MARSELYPEIQPYETGMLPVGTLHQIYWEQVGKPNGVPVVFLHGGPGAGANPTHRRFFDPNHYRVVIFDQRGSGRSRPLGETRENTTPLLTDDIEVLRRKLGIERWIVFGGSWGSTWRWPMRKPIRSAARLWCCAASSSAGVPKSIGSSTASALLSEHWRAFAGHIPEAERGDLLRAYHRQLLDPDPAVHMPAARIWSTYEGACSTLLPSAETVAAFGSDVMALGLARMEAHYFINDIFLPENSLLANVGRIRKVPAVIVQGRYDMVCPLVSADDLHQAWPEAEYMVVQDAGHSALEPSIRSRLIDAMEQFEKTLR